MALRAPWNWRSWRGFWGFKACRACRRSNTESSKDPVLGNGSATTSKYVSKRVSGPPNRWCSFGLPSKPTQERDPQQKHTHTHNISIYIYTYTCMYIDSISPFSMDKRSPAFVWGRPSTRRRHLPGRGAAPTRLEKKMAPRCYQRKFQISAVDGRNPFRTTQIYLWGDASPNANNGCGFKVVRNGFRPSTVGPPVEGFE